MAMLDKTECGKTNGPITGPLLCMCIHTCMPEREREGGRGERQRGGETDKEKDRQTDRERERERERERDRQTDREREINTYTCMHAYIQLCTGLTG